MTDAKMKRHVRKGEIRLSNLAQPRPGEFFSIRFGINKIYAWHDRLNNIYLFKIHFLGLKNYNILKNEFYYYQ